MSIAELFHAIQETQAGTAFRESALVYPIVLSTHLTCIAIFGGMILLTNLRILGLALVGTPVSQLYLALRPWKRVGGCIMVGAGFCLAGSEADKYYPNPIFWTKLTLLFLIFVHYLVFRRDVYSKPKSLDAGIPKVARVAATTSIILWLSVVTAGRWIAYWDPPNQPKAPVAQASDTQPR